MILSLYITNGEKIMNCYFVTVPRKFTDISAAPLKLINRIIVVIYSDNAMMVKIKDHLHKDVDPYNREVTPAKRLTEIIMTAHKINKDILFLNNENHDLTSRINFLKKQKISYNIIGHEPYQIAA